MITAAVAAITLHKHAHRSPTPRYSSQLVQGLIATHTMTKQVRSRAMATTLDKRRTTLPSVDKYDHVTVELCYNQECPMSKL